MIDPNALTARDFIGVRAHLVQLLGNDGNRAIILSRIYWRTSELNRDGIERDGHMWWRVKYQTIAEETGLTLDQVKRVMKWLVSNGHVETAEHRLDGITDRTLSIRVITESVESHSRSAESHFDSAESHSQSSAESHSLPSIKTEDILVRDTFEEFWVAYPRRIAKEPARRAWKAAVKTVDPDVIISSAGRYAASVANSEPRFIAHPSTWLNGKRWEDDIEKEVAPVNPHKGRTAEERRAQAAAEIEAERKRVEELSRNARPFTTGPTRDW